MEIITGKKKFKIEGQTAVAIGKFDGIHIGHQLLIEDIVKAKERGFKATVFTFEPSVEEFFGKSNGKCLLTIEEKRKQLAEIGVDILIEFPIDSETVAISPYDFVSTYLNDYLNCKYIVCGEDLSFGAKGEGDFSLLMDLAKEFGYEAKCINKISYKNNIISSTLIRDMIENGDIVSANEVLGYSYYLSGEVVHGNQIGRSMGTPTVNINIPENKILPPFGVYYSNIIVDARSYRSITNIGKKPTIKSDDSVNAETFIYDFSGDLYGKIITVELKEFKRKEIKFDNLDNLMKQIEIDIEDGRVRMN